jgi:hypothetical protein
MSVIFHDNEFKKAAECARCGKTCVTVAHKEDVVAVRDSKDPSKMTLSFTKDEWQDFVAGVKNGEFDF